MGVGVAGVAGSNENKANSAFKAKLDLKLGLSLAIFLEEISVLDHESVYSSEKNGLKTQLEQIQVWRKPRLEKLLNCMTNGTMNFSKTGIKQWNNVSLKL